MANSNSFSIRQIFKVQYLLIWILLMMVVIFSFTSDSFLTANNVLEILRLSAINAALVLGLTWVVAVGEFDVSFGYVASFSNVMLVWLIVAFGLPWWLAILIAFGSGMAVGITNGFLIGYLGFPSLLTTIATASISGSLANTLAKGRPIFFGSGMNTLSTIVYGKIFNIPILIIVAVVVYGFCYFVQDRTVLGHHLYAIGENRRASQNAGIHVPRIVFNTFILSSSIAAIGGILLTAQVNSGQPGMGRYFLLDGFTAVFLGTMIIKLGRPNVIGTFIGVVILMVLVNGLTFIGVSAFQADVIRGLLLIFGVVAYVFSQKRAR